MDLQRHFRRQFSYNHWANAEVARTLSGHSSPSPRSVRFLAHILAAEQLWFDRLHGKSPSVAVWPEWALPECSRRTEDLARLWREYLDRLAPGDYSSVITYKNSKGESWQSEVFDVLTHVILHGAYHRGQIAADVRAAGAVPAATDYIHAVRQGWVD